MELHLQSFGSKLRVKDGLFQLRVFQKNDLVASEDFAVSEIKSIWLNTGSSVSVKAIEVALKHGVDIVFMDKYGFPLGRINTYKPTNTSLIQKAQVWTSINEYRFEWAIEWTVRKSNNLINFLQKQGHGLKHNKAIFDAVGKIESYVEKLEGLDVFGATGLANTIRGLEGAASRIYFRTVSNMLSSKYQFRQRSRMPATDIYNAALNYGYGVLYAKIEKALVLAGLNPYIGFLHRDGYQFRSLVYDFIEPFRIYADQLVFQLCAAEKLKPLHIRKVEKGVALNSKGKQLVVKAQLDYFSKKIFPIATKENKLVDLETKIRNHARQLAKSLVYTYRNENDLV